MTLATYSKGIRSIGILERVLGHSVVMADSRAANDAELTGYIGWGRKKSGEKAKSEAIKTSKPLILLEDGFLGFWGHPYGKHIRLSINVDNQGIYYDAHNPSQLESMLGDGECLDEEKYRRITSLIRSIKTHRLSKYNHEMVYGLPEQLRSKVSTTRGMCLVVDQTFGDKSIERGMANGEDFSRMLNAAIQENPDALIVIKTHPDVACGVKKSAIGSVSEHKNIHWLSENIHPHILIQSAIKVYVVTSQIGFEALMLRKKVICFGAPFYAGWGLTEDRGKIPERRKGKISLEKLAYDSLVRYPVYVHPDTGRVSEAEEIVEWIVQQHRSEDKKSEVLTAVDFSLWKKGWISSYLNDLAQKVKFVSLNRVGDFADEVPIVVWGARKAAIIRKKYPGRNLYTMEDGFVRSAGLGVDLNKPSSLVVDTKGIYYDCTRPSDLEGILNSISLTQEQTKKAQSVILEMISCKTTKYNVGDTLDQNLQAWIELQKKNKKDVILVPGQVETDASIEFGSPKYKTNKELLQQVRLEFPKASIIFKPHPDQISKYSADDSSDLDMVDRIISSVDIAELYDWVDRVCVLTSLSGFEALIRNVPVSVYGMPFYAGWGLTEDHIKCSRRTAKLNLESLVYGALVKYPRYINWNTSTFCSLTHVMDLIASQPRVKVGSNYISRFIKKIHNLLM